ncbi:MAG TPA: polysaccharide biosynthesis/export family protein [Candidatus Wunengus sp. YC60]|uniref:polysaccharide biosynthesis/export family protein n=1 Tax=Candidatus Wunengus sp. YC60 TaxID=3367697 RepID=UPI004027F405
MSKKIMTILLLSICVSIAPPLICADESNEQYVVGVDDVLEISVQGHDNLKTTTLVASDGAISFPYIGSIAVKGMSLSEVEREISKRLADGYIKYPVVSVRMSTSKSQKFFVYGDVKTPGKYVLEDDLTVLKALSTAGGITTDGLYGSIKLKRKQKDRPEYKEINISLNNKKEGHAGGDTHLQAEDIVIVERNKDFFVYGEVLKPGKYTLEDNMTVLKAISLAGGFAKYGSPDRVKILRTVPGKTDYESIKVDIKGAVSGHAGKDIHLEPDDIVVALEGMM